MMVLIQWLVDHAWIFYVACAIGVIVYVVRALVARRERNVAMFTLERDTATTRVMRAWAMVVIFVSIGAAIFVTATFILPGLPFYDAAIPTSTPTLIAGVETPTPGVTSTPNPTPELVVPTFTPADTTAPPPTPLPPEPTPAPTDTPEAAVSGEMYVQFSDFAALVSYSLPGTEVTTAQPIQITLYWQALEGTSPLDYLVFTHLVSEDGRLIAQHDGVPANGSRPTTGWVAGETITDPHPMAFYDSAYTGPARIVAGLYEPGTGRVLTDTGDDHAVLPWAINIAPQ